MTLIELRDKIERREARLAVIGLGYVGLPVACEFARVGFDVLGLELSAERVEKINRFISPIEGREPGLAELLAQVGASGKMFATTDYQRLSDRDVILICVETPVDENNIPHYEALRSAIRNMGPVLKMGALVIIESTIAPGTMDEMVLPLLSEASGKKVNEGFFLGNCPERVMPGRLLNNLRNISRVAGGMTPDTAETMVSLYRCVVQADLDRTDCVTAELVKTAENAYRDVQIAFANEVALICEAVGGDVWKVRELVNKSPGRQMHQPGAGVGGHCIPKDPWLLAYSAKCKDVPVRLIPAARATNNSMPYHVVELLQNALDMVGQSIRGARILVLGYAYLENSDDSRNSPSAVLETRLQEMGAEVIVHDPHIPGYQGNPVEMISGCHAVVLMVQHQEYFQLDLKDLRQKLITPVLIVGRHVFEPTEAMSAGFVFRGVGFGSQ